MALADAGMIQRQLAEALGVRSGVVSTWIRGGSGIGVYRLLRCAEVIGCSIESLVPFPRGGRRNSAAELGETFIKKLGGPLARELADMPDDLLRQSAKLMLRLRSEVPTA